MLQYLVGVDDVKTGGREGQVVDVTLDELRTFVTGSACGRRQHICDYVHSDRLSDTRVQPHLFT